MINLIFGLVLLLVTAALYIWVLPSERQANGNPDKRALATLLPIAIACLGVAGLALVAKGIVA